MIFSVMRIPTPGLLLMLFILLSADFYSQDGIEPWMWDYERKLIDKALERSDSAGHVGPINDLLKSSEIIIPELQVELLLEKAEKMDYFFAMQPDSVLTDTLAIAALAKNVLMTYDDAYERSRCEYRPEVKYKRYEYLENMVYSHSYYLDELTTKDYLETRQELMSMGLVPQRDGFGSGAFISRGIENWVGVEFSFFSTRTGSAKLKFMCRDSLVRLNLLTDFHVYNGLTFSYNKGLTSATDDFSFSFLELYSPVVVIPARIGAQVQNFNSRPFFYYRPAIGLGWGGLSLTYSYNFIFLKKDRLNAERSMFTLRFSYPFTNHRYRPRKF